MADIILKDGAAQEQTYTGISTIKVPQVGGGYAEFSAGGGQTLGDTPLVNMKSLASTLPNTWGVITLTGSPMNIPLYFDVPKVEREALWRLLLLQAKQFNSQYSERVRAFLFAIGCGRYHHKIQCDLEIDLFQRRDPRLSIVFLRFV